MKKNVEDIHWIKSKGYDRVRAIFKLRKSISQFGDKLGKKNKLLNNILKNNFITNKFNDLNITRFYPEAKPINFSNFLIRRSNDLFYSEEIKNSKMTFCKENEINAIIHRSIFKKDENLIKEEKLDNSTEKIKSYISRKKEEQNNISNNNKTRNKSKDNKNALQHNNNQKKLKYFYPIQKNKQSSGFFISSSSDFQSVNISPRYRNNNIINLKKNKNINLNKDKVHITALNNSNIYMSLYNKNIIPKIKILKLNTKKTRNEFQKSHSTNNISNTPHIKSRNMTGKKYNFKSQHKFTKINFRKNKNIEESNTYNNNLLKSSEDIINNNLISKGINTLMTRTFNFYKRKRIPSYIRFPKINLILLPQNETDLENNYIINNGSFENYILLKDLQNQIINKLYSIDIFNSLK